MSSSVTTKLSKKQKKALAFRERKGKGKSKAKSFDELDNDVPVEENQDLAEVEMGEEPLSVEGPAGHAAGAPKPGTQDASVGGSSRKSNKRKRGEVEDTETARGSDGLGEEERLGREEKPKAKKKRKGVVSPGVEDEKNPKKDDEKAEVKHRFILFVGNLKYTTSKEAVERHFSKCDPPPTVRLMTPKPSTTSKQTAKTKGFAFVEFTHRNALQQGLKLHQSELDGRKINVELTAGGGGKSEQRLQKVRQRNKDLHEQRKQQIIKRAPSSRKKGEEGEGVEPEDMRMERPQRYSTTSGVDQIPLQKRTWSVPEVEDGNPTKKRGGKKKRPPIPLGTGVNAIPVG